MNSARALLTGLIDYAGLFPPAALSMEEAVVNYALCRRGRHSWALARFVVAAASLAEFATAVESIEDNEDTPPWRISVLAGADLAADVARVLAFNNRQQGGGAGRATVDSIEIKAGSADEVKKAADAMPGNLQLYAEAPLPGLPDSWLQALAGSGTRAKIRTGGTSPDLFPSPEIVARFLHGCSSAGVPFKATAGLHHAVRGSYPLTGGKRSPRAVMHGFLNLFVAAALVKCGTDPGTTIEILNETSTDEFHFEDSRLGWRDRWVDGESVRRTRQQFALTFGSCSFEEPIAEAEALGLIG